MRIATRLLFVLVLVSVVFSSTEINVNFSNLLAGFTSNYPSPSPTPAPSTSTPSTVAPTQAPLQEAKIAYTDGSQELEGVLIYRGGNTPLPGLLIIHDWASISNYTLSRGRQYADLGFAVFLADIYGKGIRNLTFAQRAGNASFILSNRTLAKSRVLAAYSAAKSLAVIDSSRLATVGYCFGGTVALELARTGLAPDVRAIVSFHGDPSTPFREQNLNIPNTTTVALFHGQLDPIPLDAIVNITRQIQQNGGDAFFESFSDAYHAFTDFTGPRTGSGTAARYNRRADVRSFAASLGLFYELNILPSSTFYQGFP